MADTTKTLFDPSTGLASEFFYIEMKEVDPQNGKIWDDHGLEDVPTNVAFWRVNPSPGFFKLGDCVSDFHDINPEKGQKAPIAITLKPKEDKYAYLLKEPTGFEKVWSSEGSGKSDRGYIWRMKCPDGYVALGDICSTYDEQGRSDNPPSPGAYRCIKKTALNANNETVSLVTSAGYLNFAGEGETTPKPFWADLKSGANDDVAIWLMKATGRPSARNQVCLVAGTFKGSRFHTIMPEASPYALLLNFPQNDIMEKVEMGDKKVKLKGPQLPTNEEMRASEVTNEYQVPFFAVQDDMYKNQLQQFKASPVYTIRRITRFEAIDGFEPVNTETKEFSVMVGKSTETNYNNEVGVTLGVSVEVGGEAGIAVGKTSVKVTASVEASYSHSWGGATSEYEEKSFMYPQTVTGGCFGALFQAKSVYTIYRQDGTPVGAPVEVKTYQFYTDEWSPEGKSAAADAKEDAAKPSSPNTIVFTIEAPPGKTIILEGRLEIRDGQLTSVPTVVSIPSVISVPAVANIPAVVAPPVGQTMSFDLNSPQMIVDNKLSKSYTKEAWLRLPALSDGGNNIISGGLGDEGGSAHAFWIDKRQVKAGHNNKWDCVVCDKPMSEDWEHYAVTYDADTKLMTLYRNGGENVYSFNPVDPYTGGNTVQVGRWGSNANLFIGEMAEVRIWNRARTQEEIASMMKVSVPRATPGLIAKYPAN